MGWNDTKHNRGASPRPFLGSIFFRVHGCSVMFGQCWLVFLIEKQLWNQTELESNLDIFGLFWGSFSPPPPHPMFEKKQKPFWCHKFLSHSGGCSADPRLCACACSENFTSKPRTEDFLERRIEYIIEWIMSQMIPNVSKSSSILFKKNGYSLNNSSSFLTTNGNRSAPDPPAQPQLHYRPGCQDYAKKANSINLLIQT